MKTFTLIVVAVMLVLIGLTAYLYFQIDSPSTEVNQDVNRDTSMEVLQNRNANLPENWQPYSDENSDFTFLYPAGATESTEADGAKITVMGANNTAGSEITDGFTFSVQTEDLIEDSTLAEFATELYGQETESLEGVQGPTVREVNGETVYEFKVETELGTVETHAVFEADDDTVFVATYAISDTDENSYQETIDIMLGSVELQSVE